MQSHNFFNRHSYETDVTYEMTLYLHLNLVLRLSAGVSSIKLDNVLISLSTPNKAINQILL